MANRCFKNNKSSYVLFYMSATFVFSIIEHYFLPMHLDPRLKSSELNPMYLNWVSILHLLVVPNECPLS